MTYGKKETRKVNTRKKSFKANHFVEDGYQILLSMAAPPVE